MNVLISHHKLCLIQTDIEQIDKGFIEEATFTLSKLNTLNLMHHGHGFKKHRTTPSGATYWLCKKYTDADLKCKVKAFTKQYGGRDRVKIIGEHTHPPG